MKPTTQTNATPAPVTPKRTRIITPFDEAKTAQGKLETLELKRRSIIDELSDEAAAMLEALEELRAKQTVEAAPSSPVAVGHSDQSSPGLS